MEVITGPTGWEHRRLQQVFAERSTSLRMMGHTIHLE